MEVTTPQVEFTWKANAGKQDQFASLPDSIFEGFYGGAAGGGKSELLLMLPIARGWHNVPTFHGLILRRTFRQLEGSLILRAQQYYPLFGGKYNEQKKRFTFPSGAIIDFGHAEHEHDITGYDTAEYQYIAFDELTHFTDYQYRYMISRCRTRDPRLPSVMRSASNPGNIGHGWVRKRFIEPCRDGGKILIDKDTGTKKIFISSFVSDNPVLIANDPQYVKRLELLPEAEKRAKLYGDWWTFSGQVFDEFRSEHFPGEPENALHVVKPFQVPNYWPRILAIDWGYSAMLWSAVFNLLPQTPRVYINKEYTSYGENTTTWAANLRRIHSDRLPDIVVLDKSAWAHRGDERTIAEQFADTFGITPIPSDSDRIGGKILLHEYLRWTPRPYKSLIKNLQPDSDIAEYIYRMRGCKDRDQYLASFKDEEEEKVENLPKLQIMDDCTELIKSLPLCVYSDPDGKSGKNSEDVQEFNGDDPYDGCRYGLKAINRLMLTKQDEKLMQMAVVQQKLEEGKIDQTSFYRMAEHTQVKNTKNFGVRKFSRRRLSHVH